MEYFVGSLFALLEIPKNIAFKTKQIYWGIGEKENNDAEYKKYKQREQTYCL